MDRRNRTIAVMAVAIAVASAASFGLYRTVQNMPVREVEVANYKVVVAARSMGMGTRVTADDVKLAAWPSSSPVPGGYTDVQAIINRGLLSSVVENEPLTDTKLAPVEAGAGISPTIPAGMRAMSVKVNEVVGVAGFVVPGTKVDVLVTLGSGSSMDESLTRTVASNVQVLTAGTRYDQEKAKDGAPIPSTVVTLMVSPVDAERIALAQSKGQIMLALRNPLDVEESVTQGVRTANLFGESPRPAPVTRASNPRSRTAEPVVVAEPARPYMVETIKAAKRATEEVKK
ncbi:MAG: Flp pilus assembly protein CpaB [Acidobacteria bacterium]|nr:Flp pilus assembly protein CpaB [Acidobacteriota bacterium]